MPDLLLQRAKTEAFEVIWTRTIKHCRLTMHVNFEMNGVIHLLVMYKVDTFKYSKHVDRKYVQSVLCQYIPELGEWEGSWNHQDARNEAIIAGVIQWFKEYEFNEDEDYDYNPGYTFGNDEEDDDEEDDDDFDTSYYMYYPKRTVQSYRPTRSMLLASKEP